MKLGTKKFNDSAMEMFGGKPKQQTAVEFLVSKLNPYGLSESQTEYFEQAKEMERQQIIDARVNGVALGIDVESTPIDYDLHKTHEQYYTETYENKK